MTKAEIKEGLNEIRAVLKPVLNKKANQVLQEAADMIGGENKLESPKRKKETFNQLVSKYYFKQA